MSRDEPHQAPLTRAKSQGALIATAYVLLSFAGIIGLSMGNVPFAVDLPNHAARLYVECNISDPALSRMYSVEYSLIPNLAIDLLYQPLCDVIDPMGFLRGTLALTMAGILLVVWMLHRFLNERPNAFVLLAPAMTFNLVTSMGYLNYLIGTFLFLLFAWVMLRFEILQRQRALAFILPNAFGALIFFCHIFALGLAGVFLFGLRFAAESHRPLIARTFRAGLLTAVGFALPLVFMIFAEGSGLEPLYVVAGKVRTLWGPMLYLDTVAAAVLVAVWILVLYWAFREKVLSIALPLRWPLAFLFAFSLLLPSGISLAVDLDARCFVSVLYLAATALCLRSGRSDAGLSRAQMLVAAVAFGTVATQIVVLASGLNLYERQVAEFRSALKIVGASTSVLTMADSDRAPPFPHLFYAHLGSFATVDRKAFNATNFTGRGMQPIRPQDEYACIDAPAGMPIPEEIARNLLSLEKNDTRYQRFRYAFRWERNFDYIIFNHFGTSRNPFPQRLFPVHNGSFFTIFRTAKPQGEGPCGRDTQIIGR